MLRAFTCALLVTGSALAAEDPASGAKPVARPKVYALLKDGSYVEGVLERFDGGVYTVDSDGKTRSFSEAEVRSISFPPSLVKTRRQLTRSFQELLVELAKDAYGEKNRAAIEEYASQNQEGLAILIDAVKKDENRQLNVAGKVLRAMGHEVLPTLVRIAREENNSNVRSAVQSALGEFAMDALPQIRELMADEDVKLREMALYLLYNRAIQSGTILPPALEQPLIVALKDESDGVRGNAAHILGRMAHPNDRIVPELIEALGKDRSSNVATAVISALLMIGQERGTKSATAKTIFDALAGTVTSHVDAGVRTSAATNLAPLGTEIGPAVAALRSAAQNDQVESVRKAAATTLRRTGHALLPEVEALGADEDTLALIQGLLVQPGFAQYDLAERQSNAIAGLVRAGPKNLKALMILVRQDAQNEYWNRVGDIMGGWGKTAIGQIEDYVRDENALVRRAVAHALGKMSLDVIPDSLPVLLDDKDPAVRWSALDTVVQLSKQPNADLQKRAVTLIGGALPDQQMHREYWWRACHVLAELLPTHPEALAILLKTLKQDPNADYRGTAARELGTAAASLNREDNRYTQVFKALTEALKEDSSDAVKHYTILGLEPMALSNSEALAVLEKSTKDPNESIARVAREIVGRIKQRPGFRPRP